MTDKPRVYEMLVEPSGDYVEVVERSAFDALKTKFEGINEQRLRFAKRIAELEAEVERLGKILRQEFNENDELGAEFLGITIVRAENDRLKAIAEKLAVGLETSAGLSGKAREALAEYRAFKEQK